MITFMTNDMLESVVLLERKLDMKPCVALQQKNTLVFMCKQKVVGFLVWIESDTMADLLNIGVEKSYQNQGIGSSLLTNWLHLMQQRGMMSLFCEVRDSNRSAFHFYLKFGFKVNRRRVGYYSDPTEDGLEMRFNYE